MKTMHARVSGSKKVKSDCVSKRTFNFTGNAGIQKDCTEGIQYMYFEGTFLAKKVA
jgi:hypothetical protein